MARPTAEETLAGRNHHNVQFDYTVKGVETDSKVGALCFAPVGAVTVHPNLPSGASDSEPKRSTVAPKASRSTV